MTQLPARGVPARDDRWRPRDEILESVLDKLIDDAHRGAADDGGGGSPIMVAGGMVLAVLALIIGFGTGNPLLAAAVVVALGLAGLGYVAVSSTPSYINRLAILNPIGGPGNLPAGYLVHPKAWQAGMGEYVNLVTERQLRLAVRLCREHPGSVSDVIRLVKKAEKHAVNHAGGGEPSEQDVFRVASRWTNEHARNSPTQVMAVVR